MFSTSTRLIGHPAGRLGRKWRWLADWRDALSQRCG